MPEHAVRELLDLNLLHLCAVSVISFLIFALFDICYDKKKNLWNLNGPYPLPLLGNALLLAKPPEYFMSTIKSIVNKYGGNVLRLHLGTRANAFLASTEGIEKVLSSNKHITKGKDYKFLYPWVGSSVLTSAGLRWHTRRKLVTPAFHFSVLEGFLGVMNKHCEKLCEILEPRCGEGEFNIMPLVTNCALDIICETAMGLSVNAQEDSNTPYIRAIYDASDIVSLRMRSPWLWNDLLFSLSPSGFKWRKILARLHGFTNKVITDRKLEFSLSDPESDKDVDKRKKLAFLDLLIEASNTDCSLTDNDIREEVDTFMLAGFDNTATTMSFALYLLARHPEIQRKCQEELDSIFGEDKDRQVTSSDIREMKYIELCIKETLRLYQSVPMISRQLGEDIVVDGKVIPAGTNVILCMFIVHQNPNIYPNPDTFHPERFLPEEAEKRSPYAFVPFSAGPRNCIGQKFAMREEKILMATILRKFNLRSTVKPSEIPLLAKLALRPKHGINISIERR